MTNQLDQISQAIGKLQGQVETGFTAINNRLDRQNGSIKCHDDRINELETFRDTMVGKISVISAIFGFIGAMVLAIVNWFLKK